MKSFYYVCGVVLLLVYVSCTDESENPALQCGTPSTDNYIVGQVDTACVFAELGEGWINFPETVSRFECGRILKSDFINYDEDILFSVLISIPHIEGQDCEPLSAEAIQVGKYTFLKSAASTQPGEAGFAVKVDRKLYSSWDSELSQSLEAYIEITSVEDVDPLPQWSNATYYKRVNGLVNCQIKEVGSEEAPFEVRNLEFSLYMIY